MFQDEPDEVEQEPHALESSHRLLLGEEPDEPEAGEEGGWVEPDEPDNAGPDKPDEPNEPALHEWSSASDAEDSGLEGGDEMDIQQQQGIFDLSWKTMSTFLSTELLRKGAATNPNPPAKKRRYDNTKRSKKAAMANALNSAAHLQQPRTKRDNPDSLLRLS